MMEGPLNGGMMRRSGPFMLIVLILVLAPIATAQAQEAAAEPTVAPAAEVGGEEAVPTEPPPPGEVDAEAVETAEAPVAEEEPIDDAAAFLAGEDIEPEIAGPEVEEGIGWEEPQDMRFWMVGARWRMIMIPRWLLDAFMDFPHEGAVPQNVIINHAAGLEFTTRKNNFSITGSIWWAGYDSQGDFIANETGEADDPEYIDSSLQTLWFTVGFTYSVMFTDWMGMNFGAGLGLGVVLNGEVTRMEAYNDSTQDPPYSECGTAGNPAGAGMCESEDGHYGEPEDAVWPVYPWIDIMIGLRFKVFRHLEINVEGGVGLGFIFGARASYIF